MLVVVILVLIQNLIGQIVVHEPVMPQPGDEVLLHILPEAENFSKEDELVLNVFGYDRGGRNLLYSDTIQDEFNSRYKETYDLNCYNSNFDLLGDFDSLLIIGTIHSSETLKSSFAHTISLSLDLSGFTVPYLVQSSKSEIEKPLNIVFVGDASLEKKTKLSGSKAVMGGIASKAVRAIFCSNSVLRQYHKKFNFYVDHQLDANGSVDSLIHNYVKYFHSAYDIYFDAIIVLHDKNNQGDKSNIGNKVGTAEFYCANSLVHELSHILAQLSDEYQKQSDVNEYYKGRYVSPFKHRTPSIDCRNVFSSMDNVIEHQCCNFSTISLSYVNKKGKVANGEFYKLCGESCIMFGGVCLQKANYGQWCSIVMSNFFKSIR